MEKVVKQIETFIAKDGKEFLKEAECVAYEKNVLELKSKIKYYYSFCNPDLTEGRGFYSKIYFAVLDKQYCHFERALKYMIDKYKSPIDYVMGCSPMTNWTVPKECGEIDYLENKKPRVGDYFHNSEQIFISEIEIEGFSLPIWVS